MMGGGCFYLLVLVVSLLPIEGRGRRRRARVTLPSRIVTNIASREHPPSGYPPSGYPPSGVRGVRHIRWRSARGSRVEERGAAFAGNTRRGRCAPLKDPYGPDPGREDRPLWYLHCWIR